MKKVSEKLLQEIEACRDRGLSQTETGKELDKSKSAIASLCFRYKINGWPKGAAARDQTGDKNPAFKNGLSRATINRLTKEILLREAVPRPG